MSTGANVRKDRCKTPKSRLRIESWAILTLRLRVWVRRRRGVDRSEPSCGHPPGNPEVQIGRALRPTVSARTRAAAIHFARASARCRTPVRVRCAASRPRRGRRPRARRCVAAAVRARRRRPSARAATRRSVSFGPTGGRVDERRSAGRDRRSRRAGRRPSPVTGIRVGPVGRQRGDRLALDHLDRQRVREVGADLQVADRACTARPRRAARPARTCSVVISSAASSSAARTCVAVGGGDARDLRRRGPRRGWSRAATSSRRPRARAARTRPRPRRSRRRPRG